MPIPLGHCMSILIVRKLFRLTSSHLGLSCIHKSNRMTALRGVIHGAGDQLTVVWHKYSVVFDSYNMEWLLWHSVQLRRSTCSPRKWKKSYVRLFTKRERLLTQSKSFFSSFLEDTSALNVLWQPTFIQILSRKKNHFYKFQYLNKYKYLF